MGRKWKTKQQRNFFAAIDQGPEIKDAEQTVIETMLQATDGVIPLAAAVKMAQGYQEVVNDQVCVLMAGATQSLSRIW